MKALSGVLVASSLLTSSLALAQPVAFKPLDRQADPVWDTAARLLSDENVTSDGRTMSRLEWVTEVRRYDFARAFRRFSRLDAAAVPEGQTAVKAQVCNLSGRARGAIWWPTDASDDASERSRQKASATIAPRSCWRSPYPVKWVNVVGSPDPGDQGENDWWGVALYSR